MTFNKVNLLIIMPSLILKLANSKTKTPYKLKEILALARTSFDFNTIKAFRKHSHKLKACLKPFGLHSLCKFP